MSLLKRGRHRHIIFFVISYAPMAVGLSAQVASGMISGAVTFEKDHANRGIDIVLYRRSILDGLVTYTSGCRTTTETNGSFACPNIPAGDYLLAAQAKYEQTQTSEVEFYPSATSPESAQLIHLTPGGRLRIQMGFLLESETPGTIRLPSEVIDAMIELYRSYDGLQIDIPIRNRGRSTARDYLIERLSPGEYHLEINWGSGDSPRRARADISVVSGRITEPTLEMWSPRSVRGKVHGADVQGTSALRYIRLIPLTGSNVRDLRTKVQTDNSFEFSDVWPGAYILATDEGAQWAVGSVEAGRKSADPGRFLVDTLQDPSDLYVELVPALGQLEGRVNCGDSCTKSTRVLIESVATGEVRTKLTDLRGSYSFSNLRAGEYRVYGWRVSENQPFRQPGELTKHREKVAELGIEGEDVAHLVVEPLDGK